MCVGLTLVLAMLLVLVDLGLLLLSVGLFGVGHGCCCLLMECKVMGLRLSGVSGSRNDISQRKTAHALF